MKDNTIKVIGVGGTGCNIVNTMYKHFYTHNMPTDNFIAMNTDIKSIETCDENLQVLQLGEDGLGAGSNPVKGHEAAEYSHDSIVNILKDTKLLILCAGLGGGTGSGATPEIARIAKELNLQVISIVTTPFLLEGKLRQNIANKALEEIKKYSDIYITISNEKLSQVSKGVKYSLKQTFEQIDKIYIDFVISLFKMLYEPASVGSVNTDFSDVVTTINNKGRSLIGIGFARGENASEIAVQNALNNPLLQIDAIKKASNVLIYIFGNYIEIEDIRHILQSVYNITGEDVLSIFGDRIFNTNGSEYDSQEEEGKWIRIMILITGIEIDTNIPIDSINIHKPIKQTNNDTQTKPSSIEEIDF